MVRSDEAVHALWNVFAKCVFFKMEAGACMHG